MDRSEKLKYGLSVMYTPFSQQYIEFGNTIRETKADRVREKKDIGRERQTKRHSQSNRWGGKKENKDTILYNQVDRETKIVRIRRAGNQLKQTLTFTKNHTDIFKVRACVSATLGG